MTCVTQASASGVKVEATTVIVRHELLPLKSRRMKGLVVWEKAPSACAWVLVGCQEIHVEELKNIDYSCPAKQINETKLVTKSKTALRSVC